MHISGKIPVIHSPVTRCIIQVSMSKLLGEDEEPKTKKTELFLPLVEPRAIYHSPKTVCPSQKQRLNCVDGLFIATDCIISQFFFLKPSSKA